MTSYQFFYNRELETQQQQQEPLLFDLIFIDGLHEANQVIRDVYNSLRWLQPQGTILIHDSNPRMEKFTEQVQESSKELWTGDVWKSIAALRLKADIEIVVVDVDFGVAAIRKRPNRHPLPQEWVEFLGVNPLSMLNYRHLELYRQVLLRLVSLDELEAWLIEDRQVNHN